jgi:hypothetical protein
MRAASSGPIPTMSTQPGPGGCDQLGELGTARGELLVELLQP